jgi:hypothetical protein
MSLARQENSVSLDVFSLQPLNLFFSNTENFFDLTEKFEQKRLLQTSSLILPAFSQRSQDSIPFFLLHAYLYVISYGACG